MQTETQAAAERAIRQGRANPYRPAAISDEPPPQPVRVPAPFASPSAAESRIAMARDYTGHCSRCSHTWQPRNPSLKLNRCPACQLRGFVTYHKRA